MFFRVVENRSKETLLPIIRDWMLPGSTIILDCCKAYKCLEDKGFQDYSVNHSFHFVDSEIGVYINSIQGTWLAIKCGLPRKYDKNHFDSHLAEYTWWRL